MLVDHAVTQRRTDAIHRLGLLDRAGDPALSALCRVAAFVCGSGAAAVHILDEEIQRRIAGENALLVDHPRGDSMCRLVVDSEERIYCQDASEDQRFGYSSFVQGPDPVRFYLSVPLQTGDGSVVGTLCAFDTVARHVDQTRLDLFEDLARQVIAQIELQRIAVDLGHVACHDPLTGVANRLVLADRLAQAFARRLRHGGRTLLAMVDLNHFKAINDEAGHAAGDEVLVQVAKRLSEALRAEDTVARVGGDEFVVLVEIAETAPGFEDELVRRLENTLSMPILCDGKPRWVSASVGAAYAEPGEDVVTALRRADEAMYDRKAAGPEPVSEAEVTMTDAEAPVV